MTDAPSILPLELKRVGYSVGGQRLLSEVSLTLEAGSRSVILGPNGAGKSLTLRLAHGLLKPSEGSVEWATRDARLLRERQAMVFQKSVLLRRSVAANIDYALRLRGLGASERRERVAKVLEMTGLEALAGRRARVLSSGEQQRLALARAWSLRPEVLFLDEPTASLDPSATRTVEQLIDGIARSGSKIVMTTHDLGQAKRLADEVLFFHNGRLVEQSPADTFFNGPTSEAAAAFLGGELLW
jgi:tungstate transport system ATP-binding protein